MSRLSGKAYKAGCDSMQKVFRVGRCQGLGWSAGHETNLRTSYFGLCHPPAYLHPHADCGIAGILGACPKDEKRKSRLPAGDSLFHSVLHFRRLSHRAAHSLVLGVVGASVAGCGIPNLCCPCTHRVFVLAASCSTFSVEVSRMRVLHEHCIHLSYRRRCALGMRDPLWYAVAVKHVPQSGSKSSCAKPQTFFLENGVIGNYEANLPISRRCGNLARRTSRTIGCVCEKESLVRLDWTWTWSIICDQYLVIS
jgi:hypothetical protein